MAATLENGLFAAGLRPVSRLETTDRKLISSRPARRSRHAIALHVNVGSSFKIKSSLSSKLDYLDQSKELPESDDHGGPPRWFSPLESGRRSTVSPLLLFLPGIDGDGLGLKLHHQRLGEIFDIQCLHIPLADRTPFADLAMLVESTVRSEHERAPKRPIYLVGESLGASLALVVAAQNPDIDLVLILANPDSSLYNLRPVGATSFSKSLLQSFMPLSGMIGKHLLADMIHKHLQVELPHDGMSSIPVETVLWKLNMIHEMQTYLKSHLHAVKAQTLILSSGKDMLLTSITEGEKLSGMLQHCAVRSLIANGDPLFSDDTFDLAATIKAAGYYRRGASVDYISDFLLPSPSEFEKITEPFRWMDVAFSPVTLSTTDSGEIVRGLAGIPSDGPVLLVGNHMMLGLDLAPVVFKFWTDRKIMVRGMAHPMFFERVRHGKLPDLSTYDVIRVLGAVPVTSTNLYRLLSSKSHVLLYPGGISEAYHQKGEEYKLIWPAEPEFVRMAARFGAKIVPFGSVGEDDVLELLLDRNDQMKIPPLKAFIEELASEAAWLRTDSEGEIGKQLFYYPLCRPKLPGRFYFLFGKPISTEGIREDILRNKDKARELYLEVQNEIEKSIALLKEKREKDPYRSILARSAYQGYNGVHSDQVPTFDI